MEVKYQREQQLSPCLSEEEFQKKMIERIKINFAEILDEEDKFFLNMGATGLDRIIKKYFTSSH